MVKEARRWSSYTVMNLLFKVGIMSEEQRTHTGGISSWCSMCKYITCYVQSTHVPTTNRLYWSNYNTSSVDM